MQKIWGGGGICVVGGGLIISDGVIVQEADPTPT